MLVNVSATWVAAVLVFISLEKFETVAHELEYVNEFTMACVDLLIVLDVLVLGGRWRVYQVSVSVLACAVPVVNLTLYNAHVFHVVPAGERIAHYFEFTFNIVSSAISFWLCIDSMLLANKLKIDIMLAPPELTVVIDELSRRSVHDHGDRSPRWGPTGPAHENQHQHSHGVYLPPHVPY